VKIRQTAAIGMSAPGVLADASEKTRLPKDCFELRQISREEFENLCSVGKILKECQRVMSWTEILAAYPFLQPILDTLKPVIGDAYHLLLSGIRAKQKARDLLTMTNAPVEAQRSAPHASLSYQQGDWSITLPGQHPSAFSLPPASGMQLRLDQRRYEALGGAVAEAAVELRNETSFPEERPREDWVARYVESASQVTDQTMQELWGRILAGEIRKPGSFSLRTLHVVSNLSEVEAKLFQAFGKHTVLWKWFGFIPVVENDEFLRTQKVGTGMVRILADSGLAAETPASINLLLPNEEEGFFYYGQNRMVHVRQKSPPVRVTDNCWTLMSAGLELLKLIERDGDPRNMQLLVEIFRRSGLEPQVGSYVMKNDGKNAEFISDDERDGASESAQP